MEAAVRTSGLRKAFRGTVALHGLDLVVPTGSVFGYLGPNGAGKTTTIRLLTDCCARRPGPPRSSGWTWRTTPTRCSAGSATCPAGSWPTPT